jgi:hypothetical protein
MTEWPDPGRVCDDLGAVSFEVEKIETLPVKAPANTAAFAGRTDALRQSCAMNL